MHTLKRAYRSCKGNMKKSGKGRRTCKFYEELDAILGCRPASSPLKVVESMSKRKTLASDTYSSSDSDDNDTEPPSDREIEPLTEEADESDSENRGSINLSSDLSEAVPKLSITVPRATSSLIFFTFFAFLSVDVCGFCSSFLLGLSLLSFSFNGVAFCHWFSWFSIFKVSVGSF
jgi:hypothetical protein